MTIIKELFHANKVCSFFLFVCFFNAAKDNLKEAKHLWDYLKQSFISNRVQLCESGKQMQQNDQPGRQRASSAA